MSTSEKAHQYSVVIDPSSEYYYENRLFDIHNPQINRDNLILAFHRLKTCLNGQQIDVNTADILKNLQHGIGLTHYYSLGILKSYPELVVRNDIVMKAFLVMEPPIVDSRLYKALPELTKYFERVYVHNVIGDGYSLERVDQSKLRKLFWPQPLKDVVEPYWSNKERQNRVVVINGNHKPRGKRAELYSKRINAMVALAKFGAIDLYGSGWNKLWSRSSLWLPYLLNRKTLLSIYRGACASKYETMSQYRFCLCFENMQMTGYVTEKIFDCFYAGTIPLYFGAPDITSLIPSEAYIDCRKFSSWEEMWQEVSNMTEEQVSAVREAGRAYLNSDSFLVYYNAMSSIVMQ